MRFYNWGIKPLKTKKQNTNPFRPMFMPIQKKRPIPKNPDRSLSYPQARKKYGPALSPFGNWDRDNHINMFDCRPFNPLMHRVPEEYKKRKVKIYAKEGQTWEDVWNRAEEFIPHAFKQRREDEYSEMMKNALFQRERTFEQVGELPFKDVVGIYKRGKVRLDVDQTRLVQHFILNFLKQVHPNKEFEFYDSNPSKVKVFDMETDKVYENRKISTYFPKKTPPHVRNLLSLLSPYTKVTIVITDDPAEVARKSAVVTAKDPYKLAYTSCETPARDLYDGDRTYPAHEGPYSDIGYGNAIAWFYLGHDIKNKCPIGRVMLRWGTTTGRWGDTKSIGIEYYPGRDDTPYSMDEYWYNERRARGFYGSISAETARALIGELQDILKEKGHYSHQIRTPYAYGGFSDLHFTSNAHIHYQPFKKQRAKSGRSSIYDVKWDYLRKDKLQKPFLHQFVLDKDSSIRREVATRSDLTESMKVKLAKDPMTDVKRKLLQNPTTLPREAIDYMYSDYDDSILTGLMYRSETPFRMKRGIIRKSSEYPIQLAGASGSALDKEMRELLLNHKNFQVRREFAKRDDLTSKEIDALLNDSSAYVLATIIGNPLVKLTPSQFDKFIKSRHRIVRMKMARLKYITDEQLLTLAKDSNADVRDQVLRRTNIPDKTLKYIMLHYPLSEIGYLLRHKSIPGYIIADFLERDDIDNDEMNYLFQNEYLAEPIKALVVEKYMRENNQVPGGLLTTYGKYKPVMETAMKILKKTKPDISTLHRIAEMKNIPRQYRHDAFAMVYEYGGSIAKIKLLRNPTVNREIKNIILQQRGGYY